MGLLTQTIPALLSPNRDSDIPGLQEGGVAANLRHALTDFGSPWRGIISLSKKANIELMQGVTGLTASSDVIDLVHGLSNISAKDHIKLGRLNAWNEETGKLPILIDSRLSYSAKKEVIRHERIHQSHIAYPNHPFFKKELDNIKNFSLQDILEKKLDKNTAERVSSQYISSYGGDKTLIDSERLAYANETDRAFFTRLKKAGLPDLRSSLHFSPGRKAVIEGLSHTGIASKLRKILTSFGSPWQGLDAEPQPYNENSNRNYGMPYGLTPGQAFDAADVGIMATSPFRGGTGPLGWNVPAFGALDVALSAGTSKPEEFAGRTAGAVVATVAGVAGYYGGKVAGGVVGGILGGMAAGPPGAVAGEYVGSFLGSIITPFAIDPFTRKISRPINRLVGYSQLKVNFGGGYRDSAPAYTLRMKAEQEMKGSLLNSTKWLGVEGQLMHG